MKSMSENDVVKADVVETPEKNDYVIEMLNITKRFPGIIANDNITLQLRRGDVIMETLGLKKKK